MNLFDILSFDERIIVLSNVGDSIIITWNRSQTLQCWRSTDDGATWDEIECSVLSNEPKSFEEAQMKARLWLGQIWITAELCINENRSRIG